MGTLDGQRLRDQRLRHRSRGRYLSDLRDLSDADLENVSVRRLVLAQAPVSLILRIVLMLLLRVLRLRRLTALRREQLRREIVSLVAELASDGDYDSGYVEPEFPDSPVLAGLPPASPALAPSPSPLASQPYLQPAHSAAVPEIKEIDRSELAGKLTADELRMFERAAGRDLKHIFEDALHTEYRQSLTKMFGGPISVELDIHQAHSPRLRVRFLETHECILPDDRDALVASNPGALSRDEIDEATAHLWELWKAAKRPGQFDVNASEPAQPE